MGRVFGGDTVHLAVSAALQALENDAPTPERRQYDFKEEAGRRDPKDGGRIGPSLARNEIAAKALVPEVACMANTPGGGALIVGVANDLTVIGTDLDVDWLQVRLYEMLSQQITTVITEHQLKGQRVLVVRCPPAVRPIAVRGRVTWRVGDRCQEIDPASWQERRDQGWGYDWSRQPSNLTDEAARPEALGIARRFLREGGDSRSDEMAAATNADLLRRLGVVTGDGRLTNGGAVLFVGRVEPALDYIRRPAPGADSETRVFEGARSLLEELDHVFTTARAYNPETHVGQGLVIGRVRALPERALREAIVNGVAHREWTDPEPTVVEHIAASLRVTSPGGFYGSVRADNIINHPSSSRNASLTAVLATLRIAERQGIGVDRMFGEMLRLGHPAPSITEQHGARVLTVLAGDRPDIAWMRWLAQIGDDSTQDLRILMSLHRLISQWWVDSDDLVPYLQVTGTEARQVVQRLQDLRIDGGPVTHLVAGVPASRGTTVWALSERAWNRLGDLGEGTQPPRHRPSREAVALSYAKHAGRISTTELGSIVGAAATNMGPVLRQLEEQGHLEPSRSNRRGPGFYYRLVPTPTGTTG